MNFALLSMALAAMQAYPPLDQAIQARRLPPQEAYQETLKVQYAILHGLFGWSNEKHDYSKYRDSDLELLRTYRIRVTPLSDATARMGLNLRLQDVRTRHNFGHKRNVANYMPITAVGPAHRKILLDYADRIAFGVEPPAAEKRAEYEAANRDLRAMGHCAQAIVHAIVKGDSAAAGSALAGFNGGARRFDARVDAKPGEGWGAIWPRVKDSIGKAEVSVAALYAKLGGESAGLTAPHRVGSLDLSPESLKAISNMAFGEGTPAASASALEQARHAAQTAPAAWNSVNEAKRPAATVTIPPPPKKDAVAAEEKLRAHKPGFFPVLGGALLELAKGALRTVGRVLDVVVKGVFGVLKALFS